MGNASLKQITKFWFRSWHNLSCRKEESEAILIPVMTASKAAEEWCVLHSTAPNKPLQTMLAGNLPLVIGKEISEMGISERTGVQGGIHWSTSAVLEGVQMASLKLWCHPCPKEIHNRNKVSFPVPRNPSWPPFPLGGEALCFCSPFSTSPTLPQESQWRKPSWAAISLYLTR